MSAIDVRGLSRRIGATAVLEDVTIAVGDGSITTILGDSGSGKTTLLRTIAGLEHADAGTISVADVLVDGPGTFVGARHRGIGYLPQDGALFPHLSVASNIGFGLRRRDRGRIEELLELVDLGGLGHRRPGELSGGQQQRVALARALAARPRLILLDEPFSSLDASLRTALRRDLIRILHDAGSAALIVTHDHAEALSMSDRIAVLDNGRILTADTPRALYAAARTPAAARHLGEITALPATVASGEARCALGSVALSHALPDGVATLLLRPEQIQIHLTATPDATPAHVTDVEYFGHDMNVHLRTDARPAVDVLSRVPWPARLAPGQAVYIAVRGRGVAEPVTTG